MSALRIALSGSAGTGKSTLGMALAERLELPYIEEGMRARVKAGLRLYQLNEAQRRDLIQDLWQEQRHLEEQAKDGFVSDRSSIDFAAFWLHYGLTDAEAETKKFMESMQTEARRLDKILLCPFGVLPLESDGVRSTNPWLQLRYQSLLEGLHGMYTDQAKLVRLPRTTVLDERIAFAIEHLTT